jgi:hypothetical protein
MAHKPRWFVTLYSPEGLGLNEQTESILFIRVPDCIGKYKNETFRNEKHAIGSFFAWSGQHKISLYDAVFRKYNRISAHFIRAEMSYYKVECYKINRE